MTNEKDCATIAAIAGVPRSVLFKARDREAVTA